MKLKHEERVTLLKCHNDLMHILQTIYDCHDLWISDVRKLEGIQYKLCNIGKFKRGEDSYSDYVLEEDDYNE